MEFIYYGGLLGGTIYLAFIIYRQISKTITRNKTIRVAENKLNQAIDSQNLIKKKLIDSISKIYGKEKADRVNKGTIWINMPAHLLKVAMGKGENIKESIYRGVITQKWYYGKYQTRLGTYRYKLEITIENNEVVGWKDLD